MVRRTAEMVESRLAKLLVRAYGRLPAKRLIRKVVVRLEGGQMTSVSLRAILREHHSVEVGNFSYGSLLDPLMSDRFTKIGSYVSVGPNARRIGAAHPLSALLMHPFWYNSSLGHVPSSRDVERTSCEIGNDVWIGANVTILPACRIIGNGAVIGAGAVVTANVEPYSIIGGVPAKKIGERLTQAERAMLEGVRDWDAPPGYIDSMLT